MEDLVGNEPDIIEVALKYAYRSGKLLRSIGKLGLHGLLMQDAVQRKKDHAQCRGDHQILEQSGKPNSKDQFFSHTSTFFRLSSLTGDEGHTSFSVLYP